MIYTITHISFIQFCNQSIWYWKCSESAVIVSVIMLRFWQNQIYGKVAFHQMQNILE